MSGTLPLPGALEAALAVKPAVTRSASLARLGSLIERARRDGGFVLLSGEPGAGKTRLVAELAADLAARGESTVYGRCDPAPAIPYDPFVEGLATGYASGMFTQPAPQRRAYLARLLPDLSEVDVSTEAHDQDVERMRMFDAITKTLGEWAAETSLLLVLEDLQWAEPSTLLLLRYMLRDPSALGFPILGTIRNPDPDRREVTAAEIGDMSRSAPLHEMKLAGLEHADVRELVGRWTGRPASDTLGATLMDYTGGNPFYLRSTLRELARVGDPENVGAAGAMPVPADVRAVAARRVSALGEPVQVLLRAAAIFGRDFVLEEARLAAGLRIEEAVEAADAAGAAGILHEVEGAPVRLAFEHELVRRAVVESMSPARRALMHQRVAEAIEACAEPAERAGELAMHYGSAITLDVAPKALRYARLAADRAGEQYAFDEQASHLSLACEALEKTGADDPLREYELLMQLGLARYRASGPDVAQGSFAAAADLAERMGDSRLLARAALGAGFERYLRRIGVVEHAAVELLERALATMGETDDPLTVSLRSAIVLERCFLDPLGRRRRDADEAVAQAERIGDAHALLEAETARQVVVWHPTHTEELLDRVPALDAAARSLGRLDIPIHLHCTAFGYALELNRRAELDHHLAAASSAVDRLGTPIHRIRVQALTICRAIIEGRFADAQSAIDSSMPMMIEVHAELAVQAQALWMFIVLRERDGLAEIRPAFEATVEAAPELPAARALLGEICARCGDLEAARTHLDYLARHDFEDVHDDFGWLAVISASATVAALTADRERCARLYDLLAPHAGRNVITGVAASDRPVCFALGLLASASREADLAVAHFTRAAREAREFGAPCWEGHALAELGAVLRRSGYPRAAREPLRRALDIARGFGGEALARRAREELLASGARPRRERPGGGPPLTEGELRVARLAAEGSTNREIAQALFLAPRTVETHLTHTYRKLEIASRGELARALEMIGLS